MIVVRHNVLSRIMLKMSNFPMETSDCAWQHLGGHYIKRGHRPNAINACRVAFKIVFMLKLTNMTKCNSTSINYVASVTAFYIAFTLVLLF